MSDLTTHTADPAAIAYALREIAYRILASDIDQLAAPVSVHVSLFADYDATDDQARAAVDQLAAVTGHPAADKPVTGTKVWYETQSAQGAWTLAAKAFVDRPATELEQLRAENETLRAHLAGQTTTPRHPDEMTREYADRVAAALVAAGLTVTAVEVEADHADLHIDRRVESFFADYQQVALGWRADGKGWYLLPFDPVEGDEQAPEPPVEYLDAYAVNPPAIDPAAVAAAAVRLLDANDPDGADR